MKTFISHTITLLSFITAITVSQLCLAEQQPSAVVVSFQDRETGEQSSIKADINDKQEFSRSANDHHQQAHIQGKLEADQQGYIVSIDVSMKNTSDQSSTEVTTSVLVKHSELGHPIQIGNINQDSIQLTLQ